MYIPDHSDNIITMRRLFPFHVRGKRIGPNVLCSNFATDADCIRLQQLPIDPNSKDLYVKCSDGILLWSVHTITIYLPHSYSVGPITWDRL